MTTALRTGGHRHHGGMRYVMIAGHRDHPLTRFGPRFKTYEGALHYALSQQAVRKFHRVAVFHGSLVEWDSALPEIILRRAA